MVSALYQKVKVKFQDHMGPQVMTNEVQFGMINKAYPVTMQREQEIVITVDIVRQTAISSYIWSQSFDSMEESRPRLQALSLLLFHQY